MISIIINGHREKELIKSAFKSVEANFFHLATEKIDCEIIFILDNACPITKSIVQKLYGNTHLKPFIQVFEVSFNDLSMSRNYGIEKSKFEYIAFLDGDDIWGSLWLINAYKNARPNLIYHPQYSFYFGKQRFIHEHIGMNNKSFQINLLRFANYWTALSFGAKRIYQNIPFRKNDLKNGFGYEDWAWNCDTIAKGYSHEIVSKTVHFIRMKENDSLLSKTDEHGCLTLPNLLFHDQKNHK